MRSTFLGSSLSHSVLNIFALTSRHIYINFRHEKEGERLFRRDKGPIKIIDFLPSAILPFGNAIGPSRVSQVLRSPPSHCATFQLINSNCV